LQKAAEVVGAKLKDGKNLVTSSDMETLEMELKAALIELTYLSSTL
jgi:hypothetical protein